MRKLTLAAMVAVVAFLASAALSDQPTVSASRLYDLRCWETNPDQDGPALDQGNITCSVKIDVYGKVYALYFFVDWNDKNGNGRPGIGDVKTKYYANIDSQVPFWYWEKPPPTMTKHTGIYWNGCVLACPFVMVPWYGDAVWYAGYPMVIKDSTTIQIGQLLHGLAVWRPETVLFDWIWIASTDYYANGSFIRTLRGDAPAKVIIDPDWTPLYAWSYINEERLRPHAVHHVTVSADPVSFNIHDWYVDWDHRVP